MFYLWKREKLRPKKKKDSVDSFIDLIDMYIIKLVSCIRMECKIRHVCISGFSYIPHRKHRSEKHSINEFSIVGTYVSLPY